MELFCMEVTVSNGNFEILSRNFSFIQDIRSLNSYN